jgi:hypothetical protein
MALSENSWFNISFVFAKIYEEMLTWDKPTAIKVYFHNSEMIRSRNLKNQWLSSFWNYLH